MNWLPLVALSMSLWSSVSNVAISFFLYGPRRSENFLEFTTYIVGDYLGILMITLPVHLWIGRKHRFYSGVRIAHDALIALVAVCGLFVFLEFWPPKEMVFRISLLVLMMLPALFLTFRHGWRGAAIGVLLANLGTAQNMTYSGIPGHYEEAVFIAQLGLAFFGASGLLLLGQLISERYEQARTAGLSEQKALTLARTSLLSTEPILRDQLLCMAQLQVLMDDERGQLAKTLRANGLHREALELNTQGMWHRQLFEEQALALYPIGIEVDGLFAVVDSQRFMDSRATGVEVTLRFCDGDPRTLSVDLQVLAYRCLCHAIELLSDWEPDAHRIRMRIWHGRSRRGVYLCVTTVPTGPLQRTPTGEIAAMLLDARVTAHGGVLRRGPRHIAMLLSESSTIASARQEAVVIGLT